ncbi:AsmA-like C-terminal region-containing protein [Chitiniphilus purpureus]|uniref:AsmA-like C-terminal region-containing protein n=1 Tax=Chitiniphilus purpureus TaxID=2981137 RepID=A0ABY6DRC9_9NEIS|nr:AsmA-like C-terminal region-containing protein [Chitiniphilus sp. CD1]UXY16882.1 AsmA-like C-terminal region-containing protein [Chitiniphilus sp. CD1]
MGKLKIILFSLLFLIVLVLAVPLLVPVNLFAKPLLDVGRRITHGQFEARNVTVEYYPRPALVLENVTVDKEAGRIDRLLVPLTPKNILAWGETLHGIRIEGGRFAPDLAVRLPERLRPEPGNPRLTGLTLVRCYVVLDGKEAGPVDGTLKFGTAGELTELEIADNSGQLQLLVRPNGVERFAVQLNATGWTLPFGHPAKFDFLRLKGIAHRQGIDIEEIRGDLYSGVLTGAGQLSWEQGWQFAGELRASGLQAEPFSKVFSSNTYATGRMDAQARFVYRGDDYRTLFAQPGIDATLLVRDGMLHNFDLVTPLKSSTPVSYSRGGQTRFDTVSGKVAVRGGIVQFSGMRVDGGKFKANGFLTVRDGKLNGAVAARLSSGPISVSNQIRVAGTLRAPEFRVGAAYRPRTDEQLLSTTREQ